jgi:hypothetical protein
MRDPQRNLAEERQIARYSCNSSLFQAANGLYEEGNIRMTSQLVLTFYVGASNGKEAPFLTSHSAEDFAFKVYIIGSDIAVK